MKRTVFWNGEYRTITVEVLGENEELNVKSATCSHCGKVFYFEEDSDPEQELWSHLEFDHNEMYYEWQNWNTPEMLEECYVVYTGAE